jgi:hypothetical protein
VVSLTSSSGGYINGRNSANLELLIDKYYSPFFPCDMNVSAADLRNYWTEIHESWWSYRYMFLVGHKVFSFVVKGVKVIF